MFYFDGTGRLYADSTALTGLPCAIGAWVMPANLTTQMLFAGCFNSGNLSPYLRLQILSTGKPSAALRTDSGSQSNATGATTLSTSVPQFVLASFAANGTARIYLGENLDGSGTAPANTTLTLNTTAIAHRYSTSIDNFLIGAAGPVFMFNFEPDADMRRALARGYTPDHFRNGLKLYQKLIRVANDPRIGPVLTKSGGITFVEQPKKLIYPRRRSIVVPAGIASISINKATMTLTGKSVMASVQAPLSKAVLALTPKNAFAAGTVPANKTSLVLTGKQALAAISAPANKTTLILTGKDAQAAVTAPLAKANLTLTPGEVTASSGNVVSVVKAALTLAGKSVFAAASAVAQKTMLTLTGKTVHAALTAPIDKTALTLTAKSTQATQAAVVQPATLSLTAKSAFAHRSFVVVKVALSLIGKTVSALIGAAVTGIKVTMRYRPAVDLAIDGAAATDLVVQHRSAVDLKIAYRRAE